MHQPCAEDDGRMADDIMAVDERVARLEVTVAEGFSELNGRISTLDHKFDALDGKFGVLDRKVDALEHKFDTLEHKVDTLDTKFNALELKVDRLDRKFNALERKVDGLDARVDALNGKLDVVSDSLGDKMQLVLERLDLLASESRAATQAMQREWRADRDLMFATLTHHRVRIEALESNARRSSADPSTS